MASAHNIAAEAIPDVETTNWNAVKLLATKYGIVLKSPDEIRAALRSHKRTASTQSAKGSEQKPKEEQEEEEEDLGLGTPFKIIARPNPDGRQIYHFTARKESGNGAVHWDLGKGGASVDEEADEAGYDPGPDSPSSSVRKSRRKHPSNRTLRMARSIPALRALHASTSSSRSSGNRQRTEETRSDEHRHHAAAEPQPIRLQRGDVLGAILDLRQGINADDYAWTDSPHGIPASNVAKGKVREQRMLGVGRASKSGASTTSARPSNGTWRSISPFGAPVLQRDRNASVRRDEETGRWNRSPIPRMTGMGQPLFADMGSIFDENAKSEPDIRQDGPTAAESVYISDPVNVDQERDECFIFDVVQSYTQPRPMTNSSSSVVSLSVQPSHARDGSENSEQNSRSDESAVSALPGDDPRFSLWAVRSQTDDDALMLCTRQGEVDVVSTPVQKAPGSPWSTSSRKRMSVRDSVSSSETGNSSSKSKGRLSEDSQHAMLFPSQGAFLIAASMPYIVSELTSHIDNRFMTDFFYTYRAYTTAHELLRLLIARFKWSLSPAATAKGEPKRKIVRVRTYVVIKYWISNFFAMDFLPNRALRLQFTSWLNALSQDPDLQRRPADMAIVKSLKKMVRNLKAAYEKTGINGLLMAEGGETPRMPESHSHPEGLDEAGQDANVTLELGEEAGDETSELASIARSPGDGNAGTPIFTSPASETRSAASRHIATESMQAPPPLPTSQGPISRAFLNTFSRLSRFRRHLNARSSTNPFFSEGIDGADYDTNNCGDLLFTRGGLESFLDYFDLRTHHFTPSKQHWSGDESQDPVSDGTTVHEEETPSLSSNQTRSTPASSFDLGHGSPLNSDYKAAFGLGISQDEVDEDHIGLAISTETPQAASMTACRLSTATDPPDLLHHFQSDQTLRSASRAQQQPVSLRLEPSPRRTWSSSEERPAFRALGPPSNVVQIDDIDMSSDEDDGMVRRALRRLPGARDLRVAQNVAELEAPVRQSFDSISSLGHVYEGSRRSLASYYSNVRNDLATNEAHKTSIVTSEMLDPDEALRGFELVKGFRLEHLEDSDDEEEGDVEAALRRLEGVIDEDKQRERARKVERMWQRSQARQMEDQEEKDRMSQLLAHGEGTIDEEKAIDQASVAPSAVHATLVTSETTSTLATAQSHSLPSSDISAPSGRQRSISSHRSEELARARTTQHPLPRSMWAPPPVHRSFLLDYHSDVIAQQFSLIEVELFRAVAWQELVSGQWKVKHHQGQVLDWEAFYQVRARHRVEAQNHATPNASGNDVTIESSIEAITARFNLTCNWVASEIVLSSTVELRAAVVRKLIRIAWKCYHQSNFATLTQIILGLQSPWVERLSKTWARVGVLELRMLRDLKAFINPARNFKHLRNAMREMIIKGHMEDLIISSGPPQGGNNSTSRPAIALNDGCIPFFGLFLSDLAVHDALPTFVEPSSPDAEVDWDPSTGHLNKLADPQAFDHLYPLPHGVQLSPLVNLYKYRILAMTVKSVLALQQRLDAFNFQVNKGVYVKALKLRCLEAEHLTTISRMAEP